jgi:hypothetical protein
MEGTNVMSQPYRTDQRPKPQPIKGILVNLGISQARFAEMIGRSPQWTCTILGGWEDASEVLMQACSQALDQPIEELFRKDGRDGF